MPLTSTWTKWTISTAMVAGLVSVAASFFSYKGAAAGTDVFPYVAGGMLGVAAIAGVLALIFSKVAGKRLDNAFQKCFALIFLLLAGLSLYGNIANYSNENIEFSVWLKEKAPEEDLELAIDLQSKLYITELSDKEALSFLDILLDFLEYRGISRGELKENREDAVRVMRYMYGALADYQLSVANSMLKSWDSERETLDEENLMSLADEIKTFNPIFDDKVEVDLKMIEFAAARHETFYTPDSQQDTATAIFALAAVPPQQETGNKNVYRLNRGIILERLVELNQLKKNIKKITESFESWLSG